MCKKRKKGTEKTLQESFLNRRVQKKHLQGMDRCVDSILGCVWCPAVFSMREFFAIRCTIIWFSPISTIFHKFNMPRASPVVVFLSEWVSVDKVLAAKQGWPHYLMAVDVHGCTGAPVVGTWIEKILKMIMTGLWTGLCNRHEHTAHRVKLKSPKRPKILKRHRKFSIQLINRAEFSPTQKLPKTTLKNKRVTNQWQKKETWTNIRIETCT